MFSLDDHESRFQEQAAMFEGKSERIKVPGPVGRKKRLASLQHFDRVGTLRKQKKDEISGGL